MYKRKKMKYIKSQTLFLHLDFFPSLNVIPFFKSHTNLENLICLNGEKRYLIFLFFTSISTSFSKFPNQSKIKITKIKSQISPPYFRTILILKYNFLALLPCLYWSYCSLERKKSKIHWKQGWQSMLKQQKVVGVGLKDGTF